MKQEGAETFSDLSGCTVLADDALVQPSDPGKCGEEKLMVQAHLASGDVLSIALLALYLQILFLFVNLTNTDGPGKSDGMDFSPERGHC